MPQDIDHLTLENVDALTLPNVHDLTLNEGYEGVQSTKRLFKNRLFAGRLFAAALWRGAGEAVEVVTYGKTCSVVAFAHRSPQAFADKSIQSHAPQSVAAVECCQ